MLVRVINQSVLLSSMFYEQDGRFLDEYKQAQKQDLLLLKILENLDELLILLGFDRTSRTSWCHDDLDITLSFCIANRRVRKKI